MQAMVAGCGRRLLLGREERRTSGAQLTFTPGGAKVGRGSQAEIQTETLPTQTVLAFRRWFAYLLRKFLVDMTKSGSTRSRSFLLPAASSETE